MLNNLWISNFGENEVNSYFKKNKKQKNKFLLKIKSLFTRSKDKMKFSQLYFIKFYLPVILMKVDFSSMLNSVENRAPYLNKSLLNFSIDLDSKKNFRLLTNRYMMKNMFRNYLTDKSEIKKHGFAFDKYILLKNKSFIIKNIDINLIFNPNFFLKKYNEYLEGHFDHEQYIWNEIVLNFTRQNLEKNAGK